MTTRDVATLTREIRRRLSIIDDEATELQDLLDEVETAAGLVGEDGRRIDEQD